MIIKAVEANSRIAISSASYQTYIIPLLTLYTIIFARESAFLDNDIQMSCNKCYINVN